MVSPTMSVCDAVVDTIAPCAPVTASQVGAAEPVVSTLPSTVTPAGVDELEYCIPIAAGLRS